MINGERGLKTLSKEGLEANNKKVREYKIKLFRKADQKSNMIDVLARLWIGSDPEVAAECLKGLLPCVDCLEHGH